MGYIVGLARNGVLERKVEGACEGAERAFQATGRKCRVFTEVRYGAGTWRRPRRVIARIEHGPKGRNPRFIVTNLDGQAKALYERVYCQRGEMENRIKEQQLDLFADRTSSPRWWTNQYRVALAALAYTLLETMRRTALRGTALARAQCRTIRLRLLKLGAVVTRNTPHRRGAAVQHLPRPSVVPAPGAPAHCRIAHGERAVVEKGVPGPPGPARYARRRHHGSKILSRDRVNCSGALSQAISGQSPVPNMRRKMPHYVQTTQNSPFVQYPGLTGTSHPAWRA